MLQNLANKPSYSKEAYMMSLNPFVDTNKTRMNLFLNALCDVGDFYDSLEVSIICSNILHTTLTLLPSTDGSIHGFVKERSANQHYPQRVVQHSISSHSTSRFAGEWVALLNLSSESLRPDHHRLETTNNTFESFSTNLVPLQLRFLERRTERLTFLFTLDGRCRSKISRQR